MKKKEALINIALIVISVFIVLFGAEMIMRLSWCMGGWVGQPIYRRNPDPYLRYELIPKIKFGQVAINSDGLRGPEYPVKKPENVFRILMLGDSETLAVNLSQQDTLSQQLEDLLNSNSPSARYEVLNFGVEGYNTLQELEQLKANGLKYAPDLVILNYVLNDPEPGEYYFNKTFFMRHSALVRYFSFRIKKFLIKRERKKQHIHTEIEHFFYLHQPKYFSHVQEAILEMADIAKARGNKLVVVIFPTSSIEVKSFKNDYPYWPLHKLVKAIPQENIVFIDLTDEFNRLGLKPQDVSIGYFRNESHKNAAALGVSARYIYNTLKTDQLIP